MTAESRATAAAADASSRYLVFRAPSRGQGIGTMMNGLAAALVLAARHDRQLCVRWRDFEIAFAWRLPCPSASSYFASASAETHTALLNVDAVIESWSFGGGSTPIPVAAGLLDSNRSVVVMHGDGGASPSESSERLELPADPQPALARLLPDVASRVVAHLRVGDPHEAGRRGLFAAKPHEAATSLLLSSLPADAYVLTDSDDTHDALCTRRRGGSSAGAFACPPWGVLPHSAERSVSGGGDREERRTATLRTWADWWTIKSAEAHVLHTPSAFSESALRFSSAAPCVLKDRQSTVECGRRSAMGRVEL